MCVLPVDAEVHQLVKYAGRPERGVIGVRIFLGICRIVSDARGAEMRLCHQPVIHLVQGDGADDGGHLVEQVPEVLVHQVVVGKSLAARGCYEPVEPGTPHWYRHCCSFANAVDRRYIHA
jgi:hypothetical protein